MNTKIIVLRSRDLVYGAVFTVLTIIMIILLIMLFNKDKDSDIGYVEPAMNQGNGVYVSTLTLNDQPLNLEVVIDNNSISLIRITNMSESIEAMYPLISLSLENITTQLEAGTPINKISCPNDQLYTTNLLINAIETALSNNTTINSNN